jgi:hypothetical protein
MKLRPCFVLLLISLAASAADFPSAEISNGTLRAKIYTPDPAAGYYRATRFDWSGVIDDVQSKDHTYFGQWFPTYDPKLHDSIVGPVESFEAIGFDSAAVGGRFLRIGVGWLRKPDQAQVNNFYTYDILDSGKWSVRTGKDWVELTQDLPGTYVYRKTVRLAGNKLTIEHRLKNTGTAPLDTQVFNHVFPMLDKQPTGPDIAITFPFDVQPQSDWRGPAEFHGKELVYKEELLPRVTVSGELKGYADTAAQNDFVIENRKTGARLHQAGDRPMTRLYFWSIRSTACPEAYVHVHADPGKQDTWKITYEFQ